MLNKPLETTIIRLKQIGISARRYIERYIVPLNVLAVSSETSFQIAERLTNNQYLEGLSKLGLEALVAVPAALASWRYANNKQLDKTNVVANLYSKYLLPLYVAASGINASLDIAREDNLENILNFGGATAVLFTSLAGANNIRKLYSRIRNKGLLPGLLPSSKQLAHGVAAASLAASLHLPVTTEPHFERRDVEIENLAYEGIETTYFGAAEYYDGFYKKEKDAADIGMFKAMLFVESGVNHYRNGEIQTSPKIGAKGISQLTKYAVNQINHEIEAGRIKGNKFDWDDVVENPAENIRAGRAYLSYLDYRFRRVKDKYERRKLIAAAYNVGESKILEALGKDRDGTLDDAVKHLEKSSDRVSARKYSKKVLALRELFKGDLSLPSANFRIPKNGHYDARRDNGRRRHRGTDFAPITKGRKQRVNAIADGIVVEKKEEGNTNDLGYFVKVLHGNREEGMYTVYGHADKDSVIVSRGNRVNAGEQLMRMGRTGNATGITTHLEIYYLFGLKSENKEHFNPRDIFEAERRGNVKISVVYSDAISLPPVCDDKNLLSECYTQLAWRRGEGLMYKGDYKKASEYFDNAIKISEGTRLNDEAYIKSGACVEKLGDFKMAITIYERGKRLNGPNHKELSARLESLKERKS